MDGRVGTNERTCLPAFENSRAAIAPPTGPIIKIGLLIGGIGGVRGGANGNELYLGVKDGASGCHRIVGQPLKYNLIFGEPGGYRSPSGCQLVGKVMRESEGWRESHHYPACRGCPFLSSWMAGSGWRESNARKPRKEFYVERM